MMARSQKLQENAETATIRVVEGWIGNWRISLRRRDTSREDLAAYHSYMSEKGG